MTNQNWNTNPTPDPQVPPPSGGEPPVGGQVPPPYGPPGSGPAAPYGAPQQPYGAPQQPYGGPPQQPYAPPPGAYGAPGGYQQAPAPVPSGLAEWPQRALGGLIDYVAPGILINLLMAPFQPGIDSAGYYRPGNGFVLFILWVVEIGWFAYNSWYLGGNTGYSWGRKIAKVKLVDEATGQPIGILKAFLRHLCHIVDSVICLVGWLFPLWDAKKQTLADKIMKTVVIDNSADPNAGKFDWNVNLNQPPR